MQNYQDSDYALNKHSAGIVYRFVDRIVEITLADYLSENPGKTERDFLELKALSDADYLDRDRSDFRQTWKNVSIHKLEGDVDFSGVSLDDEYIDRLDKLAAAKAFRALLADGKLTEKQERRFRLYVFEGLTHRQIAKRERVNHRAVGFSVNAAIAALKNIFIKSKFTTTQTPSFFTLGERRYSGLLRERPLTSTLINIGCRIAPIISVHRVTSPPAARATTARSPFGESGRERRAFLSWKTPRKTRGSHNGTS